MTVWLTVLAVTVLGFILGTLLARFSQEPDDTTIAVDQDELIAAESTLENKATDSKRSLNLVNEVNKKLPQTQCAQCGYPGCRPYAQAIVEDDVAINQCPPGGDSLIQELAYLLGKPVVPLNQEMGETKAPQLARIDESICIGCTLCIAACPVDAIVGANKYMHTVIEDHCTGCELCLPPCPVDCISLVKQATTLDTWRWPKP